MMFPVIELVDRYCIAKLKFAKTAANQAELDFYQTQMANYDIEPITSELDQLYQIHAQIWSLESELKSGVEHQLSLKEIGQRAIQIRNWNNKRISLKNDLSKKLGQGHIQEIKRDHLSQ
jgi:ribosomal 50S subunit-associated protein YjgA (DUF615 family)